MYWSLSPQSTDTCVLTHESRRHAIGSWLCGGCNVPRPCTTHIDLQLMDANPLPPLDFVSGCGVPLIHRDLLTQLPQASLTSELWVGKASDATGRDMDDWRTVRGRNRIIVRGSSHVSHRVCVVCKRDVYFAMGHRYLYPAPPNSVSVFESDLFGLVLSEAVFRSLDLSAWPWLRPEHLDVSLTPKDGLGTLEQP